MFIWKRDSWREMSLQRAKTDSQSSKPIKCRYRSTFLDHVKLTPTFLFSFLFFTPVLPIIWQPGSGSQYFVNETQSFSSLCRATAWPTPTVSWTDNNNLTFGGLLNQEVDNTSGMSNVWHWGIHTIIPQHEIEKRSTRYASENWTEKKLLAFQMSWSLLLACQPLFCSTLPLSPSLPLPLSFFLSLSLSLSLSLFLSFSLAHPPLS